jgi:hypothetical protein
MHCPRLMLTTTASVRQIICSTGASFRRGLNVLQNGDLQGVDPIIMGLMPCDATPGVSCPALMRGTVRISSNRQSIAYSATYNGEPFADVFRYYVNGGNHAQIVVAVGE